MKLYEALEVWRRVSETKMIRYRCFKDLETNRFCVQSSDSYDLPLDPNRLRFLEKQYLELFAETSPDERCATYETLLQAIQAHERTFNTL